MRTTYHGRVVAFQDGQYKQIVVQNLDEPENSWDRYVMLTICPNWQGSIPKIEEQGFFEFEEVQGGEKYYNRSTGTENIYQYSGVYFMGFVPEPQITESQKEFKF